MSRGIAYGRPSLTLTHEVGFSQCAPVNMDALDPLGAVRDMCKADRCGRYGKSCRSCPPACSTLEQARAQIKRYSQGILVQSTAQLEDEFEYTGMTSLLEAHKKRFSTFGRAGAAPYIPTACRLAAGTCSSSAVPPAPIRSRPCRASQATAFLDGGLRAGRRSTCAVPASNLSLQLWSPHFDLHSLRAVLRKEIVPVVYPERNFSLNSSSPTASPSVSSASMKRCTCASRTPSTPIFAATASAAP